MHGPIYMYLYDYTSYSETLLKFFEKKYNITCIHGYPNSSKLKKKITWVKKQSWHIFAR